MNELLEYVRFTAGMQYTETELKEKPLCEFMAIVERAKERVDAIRKAREGKK